MNKRSRQAITAEARRLLDQRTGKADWRSWGPYLSERQWGTVREDYIEHFLHIAAAMNNLGDQGIMLWNDPHFRDHLQFYEYFHGDSGRGVGASHQTGWTGLVANLIHELHTPSERP